MARHDKDEFDVNPYAAPETDLAMHRSQDSDRNLVYANFWQRFVASFVDQFITNLLVLPLAFVAGALFGAAHAQEYARFIGFVIGLVVPWLYFALQESSEAEATLGKRMMGLRVVDLSGSRVSFGQATGRYFGKIVSALLLMIGYLMQPFTEKKQALHDIMAGCLVIKA